MTPSINHDQKSANGANGGLFALRGTAVNRWQAPVRLNSVGEQGFTRASFSLPPETLKTGAGFGRRPFPIAHPGSVCSSSNRPGAGGRVEHSFRVSSPPTQCVHQSAFQGLADVSPVVHSKVSVRYASEARARRRPISWKPHPARTAE